MKDHHFDQEEAFHGKEKKNYKKERKILSKKDRSQYKKTDLEKRKKPSPPTGEHFKRGRVLAIMANGILVDFEDILYTCALRGILKKENLRIKNLIAVGDFVLFEPQEDLSGSIAYVEERHSILSRAEQISRRKEQLIAVNIDQVLITSSVVIPPLKPNLIDRYIIAALKGNMDPIIVINKIDLLVDSEKEKTFFDEVLTIYQALEIPLYPVSTLTGEGMEALKTAMQKKSSVFSGQSGTGKTSLINAITGSNLLTGEVISKTRKGSHTTTHTHLLPIEEEGFCVDTPGIKSFGMWDLKKEEVQHYFFEIADYATSCKFLNCSHMQEPDCAVQKALEDGEISRLRFDSYCALIASLKEKPMR
ncbi:MAG: putative ribosome biogenesis GTPase RsgA [Chlamydiae bacterium]|nr:putative ribosome biogenesis GTPase RsgA [Chlamydiota bacterium]